MDNIEVRIPAIGDFKDVGVIEVFVSPGDRVTIDQSLIALESDKATMEVPSPAAGTVGAIKVKAGDRVSEGTLILTLTAGGVEAEPSKGATPPAALEAVSPAPRGIEADDASLAMPPPAHRVRGSHPVEHSAHPPLASERAIANVPVEATSPSPAGRVHASPAVRQLARELGIDLARVAGSGPHGRILADDVRHFVKEVMSGTAPVGAPARTGGPALDLLPWPRVDFSRFGSIEARPLSRVRKISAANLARNWVMIPHVTQHDEADITELEAFRVAQNAEAREGEPKLTLLAFMMKACVAALRRYPEVNASLEGESLILKRYFHLGFAADTPHGLVVPVVHDVDHKGVSALAAEIAELAKKAREGKLSLAEMQGGSFSISSLGGIGGSAFTPIINAPEVAILGVSRSATKPWWNGQSFVPRLFLPLSLSYDHRVIDGALAARFTTYLATLLADVRRMLL